MTDCKHFWKKEQGPHGWIDGYYSCIRCGARKELKKHTRAAGK